MFRSKLLYAGDIFPSPNRIVTWQGYWEHVEKFYPKGLSRPTGFNPDVEALARVDEGRWIADCPWGCGAALNLPENAVDFWCTECVGGGFGLSAKLIWPKSLAAVTRNLETLPAMLQYWPCVQCASRSVHGLPLCEIDETMQKAG